MSRSFSITKRLVATVLLLELLSACALIVAITLHEHQIQLKAFDAGLTGSAESLMGAVQDADDKDDNVLLDLRGVHLNNRSIYRVVDDDGRILGSSGDFDQLPKSILDSPGFHDAKVNRRQYRFLVLHGVRIIDPGESAGGIRHDISILYGMPVGRVWHEVLEAVRFFAIATAILLGITAVIMALLVRRSLSPIHDLAEEADRIADRYWQFDAPESAKQAVELRPLAGALEAALTRVQLSFEQQKQFTRNAAHELKTDVAIVKSSLQLLSMRKRTVEEYGAGLALSLEDFSRLESTVQKLLSLARLEQSVDSDSVGEVQRHCSLQHAVDEAILQSKPLAELKTIELVTDKADDATVRLDERDAFLLCSNILINALQHSRDRGKVCISLARGDAKIALTVRDRGEGISEEDRPYLFNPFYRGDPSRSRKSGGTGLGLAICKAICDRVGGTIDISNHPAGGAVVIVVLPVA
jgi:Signal transduction histidine kinase